MKRGFGLSVAAALVASLALAPAMAQTAAPEASAAAPAETPKPKPVAKKRPPKLKGIVVVVTNSRTGALTALSATPADGGDAVKLAGPLKAGAKAQTKLSRAKGCSYSFTGEFEDGGTTQSDPVDLCKTPKLNLTD